MEQGEVHGVEVGHVMMVIKLQIGKEDDGYRPDLLRGSR